MRRLGSSVLVLGMLSPYVALASRWEIDSQHTSAQFAVRHLMVSTVRGTLGAVTGSVIIDEADITQSSVDAAIEAAGISTREGTRDEHLKGPDFLYVSKYPKITFKSKKVEKIADDKYKVTGDLTLRGVTKEVVLDVEGTPKAFHDQMGILKLGGMAKTRINRHDFGIEYNKTLVDGGGVVVGNDVDITIDIELEEAAE
ncbi:MAG TPA: YceI family protein [Candidatus Binatia bacterium]|nr:YceI family protein [Candidatus Binatia bacterium]